MFVKVCKLRATNNSSSIGWNKSDRERIGNGDCEQVRFPCILYLWLNPMQTLEAKLNIKTHQTLTERRVEEDRSRRKNNKHILKEWIWKCMDKEM